MKGRPIASWTRMLSKIMAATWSISALEYLLPDTTNTGAKPSGGRRNTVAAAKREAIKAKNRKEHKRACR